MRSVMELAQRRSLSPPRGLRGYGPDGVESRSGIRALFIFTFAVGTATVAAIALSPLYAPRLRVSSSSRLGAVLVGTVDLLGALSVVTSGGVVPPKDELFLCLFALLLARNAADPRPTIPTSAATTAAAATTTPTETRRGGRNSRPDSATTPGSRARRSRAAEPAGARLPEGPDAAPR